MTIQVCSCSLLYKEYNRLKEDNDDVNGNVLDEKMKEFERKVSDCAEICFNGDFSNFNEETKAEADKLWRKLTIINMTWGNFVLALRIQDR